nr:PREDICTED: uncharacterized protein LOC109031331 [Bemisia tabaci]
MSAFFFSAAVFISYLNLFLPAVLTATNQARSTVVVVEDSVTNCDDRDYVLTYGPMTVTRAGKFLIVNGRVTVQRDLQNPISFQIRIEKCRDKGNLNSCEYYSTWKWDDVCIPLKILPFMEGFWKAHEPFPNCPYKKNVYELRNFRIPSDAVTAVLPNSEGHPLYTVRILSKEQKEIVSCIRTSIRFATVRKKY